MKKHLLLAFSLLTISFMSWSQTEVFNNAGAGDNLYSNTENWNNNVLPPDNGIAQFNATASLDIDARLSQIRSAALTTGIGGGSGTVTLTGDGIIVPLLQNAGEAGGELLINAKMIFQTTDPVAEPIGRSLFRVDGVDGIITFGESSDLTLNSPVRMLAASPKVINMNGILRGSESIQIGLNTKVIFGATSDNSNFLGDLVFVGATQIVEANTADNNVFLPAGHKVQINGPGGTLTLNGANIYQGNLTVGGANNFTLNVNKDQPGMGTLLLGDGTLTVTLGSEVDTLAFGDLSAEEFVWGTGSLLIQNYKNAALRFGTSNTGITATKLAQINIGGATPALNRNGYLIDPALNTAPVATAIQNLSLAEGFSQIVIDLSTYFKDSQNDAITFSATSAAEFVSVSVTDNLLTITEAANGTATITVTATDEFQASVNATFDVTIDDSVVDSDGDGVIDDLDTCPNTPSGATVDGTGCAASQKDTDNDGVTDDLDQCPTTPSGATVDSEGCADSEKDTDNDSVTDDLDLCAGTASGSMVDSDGCADAQKDTDNDGVTDDLDQCITTPSGATVDSDGCADSEKDTDGDGVTDDIDECPDTPSGETVEANGCPKVLSTDSDVSKAYIYPNPAAEYLMIHNISKWEGGTIIIHDLSGKLVLKQEVKQNQTKITINHLEVGKYIMTLQKGTESEILTFLRNN